MQTTQDQTASALSQLGFQIFRNYKFHWNSKNTPDSSVGKNGKIKRWTDGWYGDLIDFIQFHKGVDFKEAKKIAETTANINFDKQLSNYKPLKVEVKPPIDKKYLFQFEENRRRNFEDFLDLIQTFLPSITDWEKRKEIILKYRIGYIKESKKLMIPIFDENGNWITIGKYTNNPYPNFPKLLFTKNRGKCPFNLADMKEYRKKPDEWVLVAEGHKDVLNAIGNGLNAITPGGSGDLFREKDIPLFKGMKVLVCGDYDKVGKIFNKRIANQLEGVAAKIKAIDWETICVLRKLPPPKNKFDLTNFLEQRVV